MITCLTNPNNLFNYFSTWLRITGWISRWAVSRKTFWWIFLSGPVLIWSLVSRFELPPLILFASVLTYLLPAAILMGWPDSELKRKLSAILHPSHIGCQVLLVSEISLPLLSGIIPSVIILSSISGLSMNVHIPWQTWVVIPFSALSAVSLILIIENYCRFSGRIVYLILVACQAIGNEFTHSQLFRILLFPGYVLQSISWSQTAETGNLIHGDTYMILSVVQGLLLLFFTLKIVKEKQYSVTE